MEYKTSNIVQATPGASASGSDNFTVSGYLTKWDEVDLGGDMTIRGSFLSSIEDNKNGLPLLWSHEAKLPPIGKVMAMREDSVGVHFVASIVQTSLGADIKKLIQSGAWMGGVSYGYNVKDSDYHTVRGSRVRRLKEVDIAEVSLCNWGMLPSARLTGSKADALLIAEVETLQAANLPVSSDKLRRAALARVKMEERSGKMLAVIRANLEELRQR